MVHAGIEDGVERTLIRPPEPHAPPAIRHNAMNIDMRVGGDILVGLAGRERRRPPIGRGPMAQDLLRVARLRIDVGGIDRTREQDSPWTCAHHAPSSAMLARASLSSRNACRA